jgi:hypothetical protein
LLDLIGPPVVTALWWLISRGWATGVQREKVSNRTNTRQKYEFFFVLVLLYLVGIGTSVYVHAIKK